MSEISKKVIEAFSGESIFSGVGTKVLTKFTQNYYERIVISARRLGELRLNMYPYCNDDETKESLCKKIDDFNTSDKVLFKIECSDEQVMCLTDKGLYFDMLDLLDDVHKTGYVPAESISSFEVVQKGDYFCFYCNGTLLVTDDVKAKVFYEDMDLMEYIKRISEKNLIVTEDDMREACERHLPKTFYDKLKFEEGDKDIILILIAANSERYYIITADNKFCFVNVHQDGGLFWTCSNKKIDDIDNYYNSGSSEYILAPCKKTAINRYINEIEEKKIAEEKFEADLQDQVEKLMKLKTIGLLTEEEFNQKRLALLEKMGI